MIYDDNIIRMSGIKEYAIEDGVGIRTSLYSCICHHKCKNCHNTITWDYKNGYDETVENLFNIIKNIKETNVTFSGGDPFEQSIQFCRLAKLIKSETNKTIWVYSGYTYEEIIKDDNKKSLLENCDVLVDGKFIEHLKDIKLKFRGSSNQRIIDIQESLKRNIIVEKTEFY